MVLRSLIGQKGKVTDIVLENEDHSGSVIETGMSGASRDCVLVVISQQFYINPRAKNEGIKKNKTKKTENVLHV